LTDSSNPTPEEPIQGGQSGSVENSAEPRFLVIGRVVRPHGIKGEVRVASYTSIPERFSWLERVYLSRDTEDVAPAAAPVVRVRFHKGQVLLMLGGYQDRGAAEALRGMWLLVPEAEGIPLEEDEAFYYQLEGLQVFSDEGVELGELVEVLETEANEVFVIHGAVGELLLPNIEDVVLDVDLDAGQMTVHLLPGLLP
jgi:16S rRNA processing protein RimM